MFRIALACSEMELHHQPPVFQTGTLLIELSEVRGLESNQDLRIMSPVSYHYSTPLTGKGGIRTHEAFAKDLQSSSFDLLDTLLDLTGLEPITSLYERDIISNLTIGCQRYSGRRELNSHLMFPKHICYQLHYVRKLELTGLEPVTFPYQRNIIPI